MPPKPERRLRITSGPHQHWPGARPLLIAASPTTVSATAAVSATVASPAVEPASAVSVVTVMSVVSPASIRAVVAARGVISIAPPARTGAKGDACDNQDNDHYHEKRSHPDPPFSGIPELGPDFTFMGVALTNYVGGFETRPYGFVRVCGDAGVVLCGYALMRVRAGRIL
ncbi:hypothetical protein BH18ACT11_BH18ACT11_21210 [soil metagenome]